MSDGENATPGQHDDASSPESTGNHTEGIAVADLIAKLTGSSQVAPVTRRSADAQAPA